MAARWIFTTSKLAHIYTRSGVLTVSATERVYSARQDKCILATDLTLSDSLLSFDDDILDITEIRIEELEKPIKTYGVSLPVSHRLFVKDSGGTPVLVHNFLETILLWFGLTGGGGATLGGSLALLGLVATPIGVGAAIHEARERHRRGEPIIQIKTGLEDMDVPDYTTPQGLDREAEKIRQELEKSADLARPHYEDDPFAQKVLDDLSTSDRYSPGEDIVTHVEHEREISINARKAKEARDRGETAILADYGDGLLEYVGSRPSISTNVTYEDDDFSVNIDDRTFDDLFGDSGDDPFSKGKEHIRGRPEDGPDEWNRDYDDITAGAPKTTRKEAVGDVEIAGMPDGTKIIKRPSKDGRNTIEKHWKTPSGKTKAKKIRYGKK